MESESLSQRMDGGIMDPRNGSQDEDWFRQLNSWSCGFAENPLIQNNN